MQGVKNYSGQVVPALLKQHINMNTLVLPSCTKATSIQPQEPSMGDSMVTQAMTAR
jgi:hypothetical protein